MQYEVILTQVFGPMRLADRVQRKTRIDSRTKQRAADATRKMLLYQISEHVIKSHGLNGAFFLVAHACAEHTQNQSRCFQIGEFFEKFDFQSGFGQSTTPLWVWPIRKMESPPKSPPERQVNPDLECR